MRLGVVGLASSHVDHALRHARAGQLDGWRVTDLAVPACEPVPDERAAALAGRAAPGARTWRGEPGEIARALRGRVDAVLVATRDARTHRALADPLLRAGLPLLVDKPFTADPDDAAHLVRLAQRCGVPLTSASALRRHPATTAAAARSRADPGGLVVSATGPADPDDPHGGLAFYAAHAVDLALAVLRDRPGGPVGVTAGAGSRTAVVPAGRDVGVVTVLTPSGGTATPFHLAVAGSAGRADARLDLGADYLLPLLRAFVAGVGAGAPAGVLPTGADLVAGVRVLAELCR